MGVVYSTEIELALLDNVETISTDTVSPATKAIEPVALPTGFDPPPAEKATTIVLLAIPLTINLHVTVPPNRTPWLKRIHSDLRVIALVSLNATLFSITSVIMSVLNE